MDEEVKEKMKEFIHFLQLPPRFLCLWLNPIVSAIFLGAWECGCGICICICIHVHNSARARS
jgi:hypothetical protein